MKRHFVQLFISTVVRSCFHSDSFDQNGPAKLSLPDHPTFVCFHIGYPMPTLADIGMEGHEVTIFW